MYQRLYADNLAEIECSALISIYRSFASVALDSKIGNTASPEQPTSQFQITILILISTDNSFANVNLSFTSSQHCILLKKQAEPTLSTTLILISLPCDYFLVVMCMQEHSCIYCEHAATTTTHVLHAVLPRSTLSPAFRVHAVMHINAIYME